MTSAKRRPVRSLAWIVFALYAAALFTATHWPRLAIDAPVQGTDKIVHMTAFGLWTLLFAWATRALRSPRPLALGVGIPATVYACVDEGLQAIPALGRTTSMADLLANLAGVLIALGLLALLRRKLALSPPAHEATSS